MFRCFNVSILSSIVCTGCWSWRRWLVHCLWYCCCCAGGAVYPVYTGATWEVAPPGDTTPLYCFLPAPPPPLLYCFPAALTTGVCKLEEAASCVPGCAVGCTSSIQTPGTRQPGYILPGAPCATTAMVCVNVCGLSALYRHGDVAPVSCGRGGVVATGHGAYSVKLRPHRGELKLATNANRVECWCETRYSWTLLLKSEIYYLKSCPLQN